MGIIVLENGECVVVVEANCEGDAGRIGQEGADLPEKSEV
jgi:hypothetical protein